MPFYICGSCHGDLDTIKEIKDKILRNEKILKDELDEDETSENEVLEVRPVPVGKIRPVPLNKLKNPVGDANQNQSNPSNKEIVTQKNLNQIPKAKYSRKVMPKFEEDPKQVSTTGSNYDDEESLLVPLIPPKRKRTPKKDTIYEYEPMFSCSDCCLKFYHKRDLDHHVCEKQQNESPMKQQGGKVADNSSFEEFSTKMMRKICQDGKKNKKLRSKKRNSSPDWSPSYYARMAKRKTSVASSSSKKKEIVKSKKHLSSIAETPPKNDPAKEIASSSDILNAPNVNEILNDIAFETDITTECSANSSKNDSAYISNESNDNLSLNDSPTNISNTNSTGEPSELAKNGSLAESIEKENLPKKNTTDGRVLRPRAKTLQVIDSKMKKSMNGTQKRRGRPRKLPIGLSTEITNTGNDAETTANHIEDSTHQNSKENEISTKSAGNLMENDNENGTLVKELSHKLDVLKESICASPASKELIEKSKDLIENVLKTIVVNSSESTNEITSVETIESCLSQNDLDDPVTMNYRRRSIRNIIKTSKEEFLKGINNSNSNVVPTENSVTKEPGLKKRRQSTKTTSEVKKKSDNGIVIHSPLGDLSQKCAAANESEKTPDLKNRRRSMKKSRCVSKEKPTENLAKNPNQSASNNIDKNTSKNQKGRMKSVVKSTKRTASEKEDDGTSAKRKRRTKSQIAADNSHLDPAPLNIYEIGEDKELLDELVEEILLEDKDPKARKTVSLKEDKVNYSIILTYFNLSTNPNIILGIASEEKAFR